MHEKQDMYNVFLYKNSICVRFCYIFIMVVYYIPTSIQQIQK